MFLQVDVVLFGVGILGIVQGLYFYVYVFIDGGQFFGYWCDLFLVVVIWQCGDLQQYVEQFFGGLYIGVQFLVQVFGVVGWGYLVDVDQVVFYFFLCIVQCECEGVQVFVFLQCMLQLFVLWFDGLLLYGVGGVVLICDVFGEVVVGVYVVIIGGQQGQYGGQQQVMELF